MDLYDIFQNFRIGSARDEADRASIKANSNASNINTMQDKIDHLSLVCQAMCELMEEVGFNKKMLAEKIQEIDLRDGKLDGKLVQSENCKGCSRPLAARHVKCMYCGLSVKKFGAI